MISVNMIDKTMQHLLYIIDLYKLYIHNQERFSYPFGGCRANHLAYLPGRWAMLGAPGPPSRKEFTTPKPYLGRGEPGAPWR